ncbi:MAG TPA: PilZ domain-containing protein [Bacteriovoracaceae bacterium]|nr:PilZ domain-containing protein [Bacteriovoracaceae bacterium]
MTQTFFSKLDSEEKKSRLSQVATTRVKVTTWIKGKKEKLEFQAVSFLKDRCELSVEGPKPPYLPKQKILCTFEFRGMSFFAEVTFEVSSSETFLFQFSGELYKSERRASFRLLMFPIYKVWAEFFLNEVYDGGKVVNLKTKQNQTGMFKDFLKLVDDQKTGEPPKLKIRIQDLSTSGMSLHIGEVESRYFVKDEFFENVDLRFPDEVIQIPKTKVVYVVNYISSDVNLKTYKVGLHFEDIPIILDDRLGKKINDLLRQIDFNKDFENLIK